MNPKMTVADTSAFLDQTVQNIHRVIKEKGLETNKSAQRVYFGHTAARELLHLKFPEQKIISIQIVKGGPGKTSLTKNLGIRASLYGAKVLLIDLDQQGNLTNDLLKNPEETPVMIDVVADPEIEITDAIVSIFPGLDLIPSRLDNSALDNLLTINHHPLDRVFRDRFDKLRNSYDLILIDCPPALSASVTAAALASDMVIAPVAPEKYCLDGLKMTYNELQNVSKKFGREIPLRVVINKFDSRTLLSGEILATLHKNPVFGPLLYKTFIRSSQEFANSTVRRESIYCGLRTTPAQEDIDALTREILDLNSQRPKVEKPEINLGNLNPQQLSTLSSPEVSL
jgi:chromosome partitioning protein